LRKNGPFGRRPVRNRPVFVRWEWATEIGFRGGRKGGNRRRGMERLFPSGKPFTVFFVEPTSSPGEKHFTVGGGREKRPKVFCPEFGPRPGGFPASVSKT